MWEVDILGVDISGVNILGDDILGVDILGVDILGFVSRNACRNMRGCVQSEVQLLPRISSWNEATTDTVLYRHADPEEVES